MFETDEAKRLFAAWQGMRKGDELPHYRTVFQQLPTDMLPQIMIIEHRGPESYLVRLMGTRFAELCNLDITGQDAFAAVGPRIAAAGRRNLDRVLTHPCGIVTIGLLSMKAREELAMENVMLPVANDPGRPARILAFAQDLRPPFPLDDDRPDMLRRRWIDIGFGTPTAKPAV